MAFEKKILEEWKFAIGETEECLKNGRTVKVPHTWNIEHGTEEFWGTGWYETELCVPGSWMEGAVRIYFHAAYHDARVYLNGSLISEHLHSGYTPFWVDLTGKLKEGKNSLTVSVNNEFDPDMLPVNRSFDWSNDGGLIRPVELYVTGSSFLEDVRIHAKPIITSCGRRQDNGYGVFGFTGEISGTEDTSGLSLLWRLYRGCDGTLEAVTGGNAAILGKKTEVQNIVLEDIKYWHFDAPNLYTLKLSVISGEEVLEEREIVFGFRDFHVQGRAFILNGEPVRICGTEWMPGSDPAYGSAETKEQLEKMLACLKGSNSIYTRFHWQQDDWVLDWCDRHGMLVQEEVPFWGKEPEKATSQQLELFRQQLKEMVAAHRHHPSVITWGVGNELDGQSDETIQYIKDAVAFSHSVDPERTSVYVSNSCFVDPGKDGTTDGDIMMINDYIGTWHGDLDQDKTWERIVRMNPDKPMVPSEFGLCEPAFDGGDTRRGEIFLEKMTCYRKFENVAGTIYFCLNDYRTQMGEEGEGKLRRRVHGSADLSGNPKPSYYVVQKEYAPLDYTIDQGKLTIFCKNDLPSYTVKNYMMNVGGQKIVIPTLAPGESWSVQLEEAYGRDEIKIYRPTGEKI